MTFDDAVEQRLMSSEAVVSLSAGVCWGRRILSLPWITLQIVSDPRPQHYRGLQRSRATEIQADAWALTREAARDLEAAVIAELIQAREVEGIKFQRGFVTNTRGGGELEQGNDDPLRTELFRRSIDLTLWHNG